jgi:hypothetical protein
MFGDLARVRAARRERLVWGCASVPMVSWFDIPQTSARVPSRGLRGQVKSSLPRWRSLAPAPRRLRAATIRLGLSCCLRKSRACSHGCDGARCFPPYVLARGGGHAWTPERRFSTVSHRCARAHCGASISQRMRRSIAWRRCAASEHPGVDPLRPRCSHCCSCHDCTARSARLPHAHMTHRHTVVTH